MIGHEQVIEARRNRERPASVFVNVAPHPKVSKYVESEIAAGGLPAVWTGDTRPATADLRFLVDLVVHVGGGDKEEFWAWWDAIYHAKPRQMYGVSPGGEVLKWPE